MMKGRMGATTETKVTAFGVTKTIAEWARDPRGMAWEGVIRARLEEGWTSGRAVGLPMRGCDLERISAWGERRTLREWADDARAGVHMENIRDRLDDGWLAEDAIGLPPQKKVWEIEAFGETKNLTEWSKDPRCAVSITCLHKRLREDWNPELALTTGVPPVDRDGLTAFGEWKCFLEWSRDPRCAFHSGTISRRVRRGMSPEEAISGRNRFAPRDDEAAIRPKGLPYHTRCVVAFGEVRSLQGWARDARCSVTSETIGKRIDAGMTPELAITTPDPQPDRLVTAWGETKSVNAWASDPRVSVSVATIHKRLDADWAGEEAVGRPKRASGLDETREAFGERKTVREWLADPRCRVTNYGMLAQRLKREAGSFEAAITTPFQGGDRKLRREGVTAFGERRRLCDWVSDPRCAVGRKTLAFRLGEGWAPEAAITTPVRRAA